MNSMFGTKTLSDIVKGIRASKRDTALYISQCIAEIKQEISSSDMYIKANALQKLTFLQMMGYGMTWASFATIEVMSSPRFAHKRIGYLAASQGFTQDTEVILLTTNLLKKELRGAMMGGGGVGSAAGGLSMHGVYEAGLAINCISNIVTQDLAQDLLPELTNLTNHPQPYLRKKAILCLFKVFVKYPQGLRLTFGQIQQALNDSNSSVVSCAVNVITELSDKNPRNYLHLAPAFFDHLTKSNNNWMLIKVVKLLGSLVPEEPRLARKLLEPLAQIVRNTPAKSLLYEAVHAITLCLPYCRKNDGSMPASVPDIVTLCAKTLRDFVEERDQNLKYLGLVGFGSLMQSHPKVLSATDYRPLILACLSDEDVTIRSRALGLLPGMASRKNLMELVKQLLRHVRLATGTYKLELVEKIVEMCSGDKYALLQNFSWYLDVLFQLGHMRGLDTHASLLRAQITDVALRVLPVRSYAVKRSTEILLEGERRKLKTAAAAASSSGEFLHGDNGRGRHIMKEILPAVAWIIGEYSELLPEAISMDNNIVFIYNESSQGPYHSVVQAMTAPSNSIHFPMSTQKILIQAGMKVFAAATANSTVSDEELEACVKTLELNLLVFMQSSNVEVQERAATSHALLKSLNLKSSSDNGLDGMGKSLNGNSNNDTTDNGLIEGDLLGMPGSTTQKPKSKPIKQMSFGGSTSLASRCRNASQTLNYTFKPSPMKPTSAKAQRKKHQSANGMNDDDLDASINLSVFSTLIIEDVAYRGGSKTKLSMEAVSFTQQKPLRVQDHHVSIDAISSTDFSQSTVNGSGVGKAANDYNGGMGGSSQSFQRPNMVETALKSSRPQNASDPFYLNSGPALADTEDNVVASRFGTIELGDAEESDDDDADNGKQKKKKKDKKQKKQKKVDVPSLPPTTMGMGSVTVYNSDDDEDDNSDMLNVKPARRGPRKLSHGNEFSSLAKVDLTMPLREDEVMPERKHRVVPDRPTAQAQTPPAPPTSSKPKKSKKESKRSKKDSKKISEPADSGQVGDLLDLSAAFDTTSLANPSPVPSSSMPMDLVAQAPGVGSMMSNQSNPINNAFDDLLGLSAPASTPAAAPLGSLGVAPVPPPSSGAQSFGMNPESPPTSPSKSRKRPWMRATIKSSNASGSPVVDWSKVSLHYRVYRSSNANAAASIVLRADNAMEMSALSGLTLQLKDHGDIRIGDVRPGASVESEKVGPFSYLQPDAPFDMKGTLVTADCSVPIKFSLPATMHLNPLEGLSLEDVASQLSSSSSSWSSQTVKVDLSGGTSPDKVKPILGSFLRAAEVAAGMSGPMNGTFAAQSAQGFQVRVLAKIKKDSVKVDVKTTNPVLGKALVADLKRLVL